MNGIDIQFRVLDEVDVTADDLAAWSAASSSSELVSIYLPTHRAGKEVTQDPVRFRRLVANAADEVAGSEVLAAATRLVDDREFWAHGTDGLAVFAGADGTTAIRLSQPNGEFAIVSDRFHLKPLVAALGRRVGFDVLALSRHSVRFVEVNGSRVAEVDVPDMPTSMPEALRYDDREPQVQSHSATRVGGGIEHALGWPVDRALPREGGVPDVDRQVPRGAGRDDRVLRHDHLAHFPT